jgi:hypothetical protein
MPQPGDTVPYLREGNASRMGVRLDNVAFEGKVVNCRAGFSTPSPKIVIGRRSRLDVASVISKNVTALKRAAGS